MLKDRQALECERLIKVLSRISHPNVLPLFCVFADTVSLYLVFDFCHPANDLLDRVVSDSPTAMTKVIAPLASALACLHEKHIAHRDVCAENLVRVLLHMRRVRGQPGGCEGPA